MIHFRCGGRQDRTGLTQYFSVLEFVIRRDVFSSSLCSVIQKDMAQDSGAPMAGLPALPEYTGHASGDDVHHVPMEDAILSLQDSERELIRRALEKHRNKRKHAAEELGISERTLYRKIKEYDLK